MNRRDALRTGGRRLLGILGVGLLASCASYKAALKEDIRNEVLRELGESPSVYGKEKEKRFKRPKEILSAYGVVLNVRSCDIPLECVEGAPFNQDYDLVKILQEEPIFDGWGHQVGRQEAERAYVVVSDTRLTEGDSIEFRFEPVGVFNNYTLRYLGFKCQPLGRVNIMGLTGIMKSYEVKPKTRILELYKEDSDSSSAESQDSLAKPKKLPIDSVKSVYKEAMEKTRKENTLWDSLDVKKQE